MPLTSYVNLECCGALLISLLDSSSHSSYDYSVLCQISPFLLPFFNFWEYFTEVDEKHVSGIWGGSLPWAGRQPQLQSLTVVTGANNAPMRSSWDPSNCAGRSVPFLLLSATGIFVETPKTIEVSFSPNRNLCSHLIGNPIPWGICVQPNMWEPHPSIHFPHLAQSLSSWISWNQKATTYYSLLVIQPAPSIVFSLRAKSTHLSVLFDLLGVERERKKRMKKLKLRIFYIKKKISKFLSKMFSQSWADLSLTGSIVSRLLLGCPFIKVTCQPLSAFEFGTPALYFKARRPEEDSFLLLIPIVVPYLCSQLQEPLQLPFHPNTMV